MPFSFYYAALADLNNDASLVESVFQRGRKVGMIISPFNCKSDWFFKKMIQKVIWAAN